MAFRRVAARVARPGRKIDFKQWSRIPGGSQNLTLGTAFAGPGILNFDIPATILRVRGVIRTMFLTTGLTAQDEATVRWGLGIFSQTAAAAGPTAMPNFGTDPEFPWLWVAESIMFSPNADFADPFIQVEHIVDTKAMRKVKPEEAITLMGFPVNVTGAPLLRVDVGDFRVLVGT